MDMKFITVKMSRKTYMLLTVVKEKTDIPITKIIDRAVGYYLSNKENNHVAIRKQGK